MIYEYRFSYLSWQNVFIYWVGYVYYIYNTLWKNQTRIGQII